MGISATLSGIAEAWDCAANSGAGAPSGAAITITPAFIRTGTQLKAMVRILGTVGTSQTMVLDMTFANDRTQRETIDLSTQLATFNNDKTLIAQLTGNVKTPVLTNVSGNINNWTSGNGAGESGTANELNKYNSSGSGTQADPYLIVRHKQLADLAAAVNGTTPYSTALDMNGVYFKQMIDISLADYTNWIPIGKDETKPFKGNFDGSGKTVSNMSITSGDARSSYCMGLFGCVADGSVTDITVNGIVNLPQHETGNKYIGIIIGYLKSGSVNNLSGTVTMTLSSGGFSNNDMYVGGAIGRTDIQLSSGIFSVTPTISFRMDATPPTGPRAVGHNVSWCIDSDKTKSANSPHLKDDSAFTLSIGSNILRYQLGYSNGYLLLP